jgi:predicted ArsR family transcriptional regulator
MTSIPNGEPEPRIRLDARNLRGIAHPVRVRMLTMLRDDGPATATGLARRLGLNTGATSYHLRQLAAHGFVVEDAGRGTARERWWRAAHQSTLLDRADLAGDEEGLGWAYLRSVAELYADGMLRAVDELPTLPEAWRAAGAFSDYPLQLTPEELLSLVAEVTAVIRRYQSAGTDDAPAGSAPVTFQFQAFRRPGSA